MIRTTPFAVLSALALVVGVAVPFPVLAGNDGVVPAHEQKKNPSKSAARIEENIGTIVPLDTAFRDESDQPITLRECINDKPTILVPVYYRCPMLCTKILNGLVESLRAMPSNFSIGREFNVITVSMDPKERGGLATEKKNAYLAEYGRPGAENGWRFLTGTKEASTELLNAVGFKYEFDKMLKEYDHPSGLIILSPQGKVTRYFYGIGYDGSFEIDGEPVLQPNGSYTRPTTTLRLSLIEAAEGKGGSLLTKLQMLCYRYDALHQGYALNVLRVVQLGGVLTLLAVGSYVFLAFRREGKRARLAATQTTTASPTGGTA